MGIFKRRRNEQSLHAGRAASAGVFSAYLSQSGFTAASKILEGEKGFCPALSEAPRIEKITQNLSYGDLKIQHNSFKPYACCKHAHAAVYGAQTLRGSYGIKPEDIDCVEIRVNNITDFLINNPAPQNVYGCNLAYSIVWRRRLFTVRQALTNLMHSARQYCYAENDG